MRVSRLLAIGAVVAFVLALVGFHASDATLVGLILFAGAHAID